MFGGRESPLAGYALSCPTMLLHLSFLFFHHTTWPQWCLVSSPARRSRQGSRAPLAGYGPQHSKADTCLDGWDPSTGPRGRPGLPLWPWPPTGTWRVALARWGPRALWLGPWIFVLRCCFGNAAPPPAVWVHCVGRRGPLCALRRCSNTAATPAVRVSIALCAAAALS